MLSKSAHFEGYIIDHKCRPPFRDLVITALLVGIDEWKNRSTRLMRVLRWRRTDGGCGGGGGGVAIDGNAVRDICVSAAAVVHRH